MSLTRTIASKLFNAAPPFVQHKLAGIEKRFLTNSTLHKLLDVNFKEFSFIQIGANDGVSFDNLFEYLKTRQSLKRGIVVEPIGEYFSELQKNYSGIEKVICLNYALHPTLSEITLFKVDKEKIPSLPEWSKGIASILPTHHDKLGIPKDCIVEEKVKCISFKQLFDEFSPRHRHFNFLQIDTEGFDAEIIKMIDFKTMRFDMIKYEHVNLTDEDRREALRILNGQNYTIIDLAFDTIAISKSLRLESR